MLAEEMLELLEQLLRFVPQYLDLSFEEASR